MEQTVHNGQRAKKEQKESIARKMLDKNSKSGRRKRKLQRQARTAGKPKKKNGSRKQNGAKRGVHQHGRGEEKKTGRVCKLSMGKEGGATF